MTTEDVAMGMSMERFDGRWWAKEECAEEEVVVAMVVADERMEMRRGWLGG